MHTPCDMKHQRLTSEKWHLHTSLPAVVPVIEKAFHAVDDRHRLSDMKSSFLCGADIYRARYKDHYIQNGTILPTYPYINYDTNSN